MFCLLSQVILECANLFHRSAGQEVEEVYDEGAKKFSANFELLAATKQQNNGILFVFCLGSSSSSGREEGGREGVAVLCW